jgi:hypothetical protein
MVMMTMMTKMFLLIIRLRMESSSSFFLVVRAFQLTHGKKVGGGTLASSN